MFDPSPDARRSPAYLEQLQQATIEQLDEYAARVLTAESIETVFAD